MGPRPPGRWAVGSSWQPLDLAQKTSALAQEYAVREFASESAEVREEIGKGLEGERKAIESALAQKRDQFRTAIERSQRTFRERYFLSRSLGLTGDAIAMLKELKEGEMGREFQAEAPQVALEMVALELVCGRLEDAAADIAQLKDEFAKLDAQSPAAQALPQVLRHIEFQKLVLEGNYRAAGTEYEALYGAGIGTEPLVAELLKLNINPTNYKDFDTIWPRLAGIGVAWPSVAMLGNPLLGNHSPLAVVTSYWGGRAAFLHLQQLAAAREEIARKLQQDAQFFYRRGVLSMIEGDMVAAKTRFHQANSLTVPEGWGVVSVRHFEATQYLQLIERAEKKAAQP